MSYWIAIIVSKIACVIPWQLCRLIGWLLGHLSYLFIPPKRKRMAKENIIRCLQVDESEASRIAKASWVQFGAMLFEVLRFPVLKHSMREHVEVEGLEHLTKYRESTNGELGAVIMTSHSDNWELMGGAFAQYGISLVGVAKKQKSTGMDKFINEYRTLIGMHITYRSGVREMYKMLGEGWFIGLIMDQDTGRHDGTVVKFFNEPTNFATGAAAMSRFKKIPIFPAFMHRKLDGTHKLIIREPIYTETTNDKRADINKTTQILASMIEKHIYEYPEQWFWLHDRWKSMRVEFTPEEVEQLRQSLYK